MRIKPFIKNTIFTFEGFLVGACLSALAAGGTIGYFAQEGYDERKAQRQEARELYDETRKRAFAAYDVNGDLFLDPKEITELARGMGIIGQDQVVTFGEPGAQRLEKLARDAPLEYYQRSLEQAR